MIEVLVVGYGVMTRGILPHLLRNGEMSVFLMSRHLTSPPYPEVRLIQETDLESLGDSGVDAELTVCRPDVVLGCFENDAASRDFWTSPHVTAAIARNGSACIEMSTLSPAWIDAWHGHIRKAGGVAVECPVTGSRSGAAEGTLSAFVHQSVADARVETVLNTFTRQRYSFGTAGHPTRFKLVYNAWGAALLHSLTAFVPALRTTLADDFDVAARILSSDGWMSLVCASKLDRMVESRFGDPDFALRHMVKDLRYARGVLPEPNPLLDLVHDSFAQALAVHGDEADYTAVTASGIGRS
ncbi:NAD(P)-binding domain-containing protein [Streptomyces sp. NPDC017413]|uniref:NAD(P)-binding domain-containing protein n=1 Tax=Streptomyces sp. NPDC017413 TaxID=3364994 RepID=UPI0037B5631F